MKSEIAYRVAMVLLIPFLAFAQIERWVYTYNGTGSDQDIAYDVAYGLDGNIYAAGKIVTTSRGSDFVVVNLKDNGDTNWMYVYDGTGYEDMATSVVYGLDNNIYAAGISGTPSTYWDFLVVSLTTDGDTNWIYRHDGPSSGNDGAYCITYGLDGNIYAAGSSAGDIFVVSLSATGDTNWTYRYSGTGVATNGASSITYGGDGNIYVAGVSCDGNTSWDFFVASLSPAGDANWTYRYDGGGASYDIAKSVVYGLDGNVYAAGYSTTIGADQCLTVTSLSSLGSENWVYTYRGDNNQLNTAKSIAYGTDNNIYVAGVCSWASSGADFTVLSLNTAGDTNWIYRLPGFHDFDDAKSIVYGADGNIYTAGTVVGGISAKDFAVVSLGSDGTQNWIYTYTAAPTYWWDEALAVTYGLDGKVYAAGYSIDSTSIHLWDFTVISLDPNTGVEEADDLAAGSIRLDVMPNPFTDRAMIRYSILDARYLIEDPIIKIYDAAGRMVKSFYHGSVVSWDGRDDHDRQLPGGVYFVQAAASGEKQTVPVLLVR